MAETHYQSNISIHLHQLSSLSTSRKWDKKVNTKRPHDWVINNNHSFMLTTFAVFIISSCFSSVSYGLGFPDRPCYINLFITVLSACGLGPIIGPLLIWRRLSWYSIRGVGGLWINSALSKNTRSFTALWVHFHTHTLKPAIDRRATEEGSGVSRLISVACVGKC